MLVELRLSTYIDIKLGPVCSRVCVCMCAARCSIVPPNMRVREKEEREIYYWLPRSFVRSFRAFPNEEKSGADRRREALRHYRKGTLVHGGGLFDCVVENVLVLRNSVHVGSTPLMRTLSRSRHNRISNSISAKCVCATLQQTGVSKH